MRNESKTSKCRVKINHIEIEADDPESLKAALDAAMESVLGPVQSAFKSLIAEEETTESTEDTEQ